MTGVKKSGQPKLSETLHSGVTRSCANYTGAQAGYIPRTQSAPNRMPGVWWGPGLILERSPSITLNNLLHGVHLLLDRFYESNLSTRTVKVVLRAVNLEVSVAYKVIREEAHTALHGE